MNKIMHELCRGIKRVGGGVVVPGWHSSTGNTMETMSKGLIYNEKRTEPMAPSRSTPYLHEITPWSLPLPIMQCPMPQGPVPMPWPPIIPAPV
jgi:hypothetical protein